MLLDDTSKLLPTLGVRVSWTVIGSPLIDIPLCSSSASVSASTSSSNSFNASGAWTLDGYGGSSGLVVSDSLGNYSSITLLLGMYNAINRDNGNVYSLSTSAEWLATEVPTAILEGVDAGIECSSLTDVGGLSNILFTSATLIEPIQSTTTGSLASSSSIYASSFQSISPSSEVIIFRFRVIVTAQANTIFSSATSFAWQTTEQLTCTFSGAELIGRKGSYKPLSPYDNNIQPVPASLVLANIHVAIWHSTWLLPSTWFLAPLDISELPSIFSSDFISSTSVSSSVTASVSVSTTLSSSVSPSISSVTTISATMSPSVSTNSSSGLSATPFPSMSVSPSISVNQIDTFISTKLASAQSLDPSSALTISQQMLILLKLATSSLLSAASGFAISPPSIKILFGGVSVPAVFSSDGMTIAFVTPDISYFCGNVTSSVNTTNLTLVVSNSTILRKQGSSCSSTQLQMLVEPPPNGTLNARAYLCNFAGVYNPIFSSVDISSIPTYVGAYASAGLASGAAFACPYVLHFFFFSSVK
jgi:hypothetical protein